MTSFRVLQLTPDYINDDTKREINILLKQFSPQAETLTTGALRRMAESNRFYIALSEDESIVGMATLVIYRKPTGLVGMVEDVAVAENNRGKGIGRQLMNALITTAKLEKLKSVLRVRANSEGGQNEIELVLSLSAGFVPKERRKSRISWRFSLDVRNPARFESKTHFRRGSTQFFLSARADEDFA